MDLILIRDTVSGIAKRAGAELMRNFDKPHQERTKSSVVDIVTEGDMASEAVIVPALLSFYPEHHIVSEEGSGGGTPAEFAEYFWFIDPLDGTSNYANNIPFFTVSIGLADRRMTPLLGVVYDPFSDELFSAAMGEGAFLNGRQIHVSQTTTVQQAMVCSGFSYANVDTPDNNIREWALLNARARGVRRFGSMALELAYIAAGRLDGLWEEGLHLWDTMGGMALVREAGGHVSDYNGAQGEKLYRDGQILATNGQIHREMMDLLLQARASG